MNRKYILNAAGEPVVCDNLFEWAAWFEAADRAVAKTDVDGARVSTVFLGLDHSFGGPVPLLYETMIFAGPLDGEQDRYPTRATALLGHNQMVARARAALAADQPTIV